ncbi:hypothetical protein Glove_156g95 [Diversispora epigaea]|uniref:Uncharacterized protein n=1 Tax=Diversispora epigaea TaxID=1348612 RepID=A0A397IVS5_9GLOM|nr:hypothetical protein Glove_156g95 [Diversispora epigaea]
MADLPPAPPGINIKEKENLEIQTLAGINSDQKYAHDAIEGYCIDFQKSNSKKINPTTFILPKEKTFDTKDKLQTTKSTEGNINSKSRNTDSQNKIVNYENTISEFAKKVIRDEDKILSSPSQQRPSIKLNNTKKKKVILQMSLFGRIWTALDRMTTSNTRIYFKKLNSYNSEMNKKVELENSYNNFENNEIMTTRIQIFTEKVMECFYLLKPQLSITINIESELIELMSTFRFDNLLVMLKNLENNILCMVFIYALSIDIPQLHENIFSSDSRSLTNIKSVTFNVLLKSMNITTEELDAFVRVLRVGST